MLNLQTDSFNEIKRKAWRALQEKANYERIVEWQEKYIDCYLYSAKRVIYEYVILVYENYQKGELNEVQAKTELHKLEQECKSIDDR